MKLASIAARTRHSAVGRYHKYRWWAFECAKPLLRRRFGAPPAGTIFIFGCQRSGTTHLERLFRADPRSVVFGEFSGLSVTPERTLWAPYSTMKYRIAQQPARYAVIRSLLASHHARKALDEWPASAALWVFRDANSVVDSMVRKWGNSFHAISRRVESDPQGGWELEQLWDAIEAEAEAVEPAAEKAQRVRDVYALFWLYRNALVIENNLADHPRVLLADYADLTERPEAYLNAILSMANIEAMGWNYPIRTRRASLDATDKPRLSQPIQERCDALYLDLRIAAAASRACVEGRAA